MKKLISILILLFSFANGFSQGDSLVYNVVEEVPQYPGGKNELIKFLQTNLATQKTHGVVYVKYIVNASGKVSDATVIQSSGSKLLDDEAIRVISIMPNWTPGKLGGKSVSSYVNLPVNFKADRNGDLTLASSILNYNSISMILFFDSYGNEIKMPNNKFQSLPEFIGGVDSM